MIKTMTAGLCAPIALLALAGCATPGEVPATTAAAAGGIETIRYATTACHGFCPVYTVTVSSDGAGMFEGEQHVAATGAHRFTVTPAQFLGFKQRLAPFRPAGEAVYQPDQPLCGPAVTDLPGVDIRWQQPGTASSHLDFYYGCGGEPARAMRDGLRAAPEALPIADLIGKR